MMKHSLGVYCLLQQSADSIDVALTSPGNRDRHFKPESGIGGDRPGKPGRPAPSKPSLPSEHSYTTYPLPMILS